MGTIKSKGNLPPPPIRLSNIKLEQTEPASVLARHSIVGTRASKSKGNLPPPPPSNSINVPTEKGVNAGRFSPRAHGEPILPPAAVKPKPKLSIHSLVNKEHAQHGVNRGFGCSAAKPHTIGDTQNNHIVKAKNV